MLIHYLFTLTLMIVTWYDEAGATTSTVVPAF